MRYDKKRGMRLFPSPGLSLEGGMVGKLLVFPHGMADSVIKWLLRVEDWLMKFAGVSCVDGVIQISVKREGRQINVILAKEIEELLI